MPFIHKPIVDQWYRHLDKGGNFRVVAMDDAEHTIEIQYFDGDVEEIDLENWYPMDIEPIEPPEDWTGPMDDIERDDLGYNETGVVEDVSGLTPEQIARRISKREGTEEVGSKEGEPE